MPHRPRVATVVPLLAVAALAACAGPGLEVDEVLVAQRDGDARASASAADRSPVEALDAAAHAARARADRADATASDRIAAARALFLAADARVQRAVIAEFEARDASAPPTIAWVLDAEDRVGDAVRAEVEALTRAGLAYAEPSTNADALLAKALNTCLLAWSVGTRRALFEGLGGACDDATAAALAADEALDDAAPLRLRGRFLSRAPWPVGDRAEGLRLLRRAVEIAPVRLNLLFLGDALWQSGDEAGARAAWRRAADAERCAGAENDSRARGVVLDGWRRELARLRLVAAESS